MDARFQKYVDNVLIAEGGYVNDPKDPGGETKFGISKRRYPTLDIKNLTRDQAVEIYHQDFWLVHHYDRITNDSIAGKVFDLCVNMGPNKAHVLLQIALNFTGSQVVIDGRLGPKTLEAINNHSNPAWLLAAYKVEAVKYYLKLNMPRFSAGWVRRAVA